MPMPEKPKPNLQWTPGRTMAARHQLELSYHRILRQMLRETDPSAAPWGDLGLSYADVMEARGEHEDERDVVLALLTRVRTQATVDFNAAQWDSMPDGFSKRWVARHDPRTRHAHLQLDGVTIPKFQPFRSGTNLLMFPGDPTAPPELTFNCRCVLIGIPPANLTAAASTEEFEYNPAQLRIPKGNGKISGRWMDSPFSMVSTLIASFADKKGIQRDLYEADYPPDSLRPEQPGDRELIEQRYGIKIPVNWVGEVLIDPDATSGKVAQGVAKARNGKTKPAYIYTNERLDQQAALKFNRVREITARLPQLENAIADVSNSPTAAAVRLMYLTGIRVGSTDEQQGRKKAYGATTLRMEHLKRNDDGTMQLNFVAKEGIDAEYVIDDPELVSYLQSRLDSGDTGDVRIFDTNSTKTQQFLKDVTGFQYIKNHDLRTLLANVLAVQAGARIGAVKNKADYNKKRLEIAEEVAAVLRNKREQARDSYISPAVYAFLEGAAEALGETTDVPAVAASAGTYNPAQLRVPKGNGELSGRWMDSPFTLISDIVDLLTKAEKPRPKGELNPPPPRGSWVKHTDALFARTNHTVLQPTEEKWKTEQRERIGDEAANALELYLGDLYYPINKYLRSGEIDTAGARGTYANRVQDTAAEIERAFEDTPPLEDYIVVKRGVHASWDKSFDPATYYTEGAILQESGFTSTTWDAGEASRFRAIDGWTMNIMVPPGYPVLYGTWHEREVILPPGLTQHVVKVDEESRTIWLEVERP